MPAGRSWLQAARIIDWLLIRNAQGSIQDEQDRDIVVGLEQARLGQGQGQGGDSDRAQGQRQVRTPGMVRQPVAEQAPPAGQASTGPRHGEEDPRLHEDQITTGRHRALVIQGPGGPGPVDGQPPGADDVKRRSQEQHREDTPPELPAFHGGDKPQAAPGHDDGDRNDRQQPKPQGVCQLNREEGRAQLRKSSRNPAAPDHRVPTGPDQAHPRRRAATNRRSAAAGRPGR